MQHNNHHGFPRVYRHSQSFNSTFESTDCAGFLPYNQDPTRNMTKTAGSEYEE